ncbi:recombinase family protein [Paenibacillus sp. 19GGS1-52]|uniref:recombinase family protein n=1 Tax=Paenibacillus sp. 19GGS1-52 TaxID=2758563 RepID=UPI001EFB8CC3|nr:recombinase family protein [Paenibacillus sp. 19GGS1-52]ULO09687.1 recombinase family protein [Paenibacillus sp. 19GGS1-52]
MITVAAYGRVSTKHDDQLNSLQAQINYYSNYTNDKENMQLHKVYHDTLSATRWEKRKGFRELLHDAGLDIATSDKGTIMIELSDRKPLFNRILVKDISRFTRNVNDNRIFTLLRDKGVYIDFTNMNLSTENMSEETMLQIMMVFSQRESQDRSEKVLFGLKESAKNGRIRMKDNFYGYRLNKELDTLITLPDGTQVLSNSLEIVPEEAEIVRMIYGLYIEGNGLRKILQYLEANGILRDGKPFSQTTINRMLNNPAYKGVLVRNKMESPLVFSNKKSATLKDEKEWEIFENRIPAIVDADTFANAQKARGGRINQDRKGIKTQHGKYSGKIKCEKCGKGYVQNRDRHGNLFMNCATRKTKGVAVCSAKNVRNDLIDVAVNEFIGTGLEETIMNFKKSYTVELNNLKKELYGKIDNQQIRESEALQLKIKDVMERKERLGMLFVMGNFNEETLQKMAAEIDMEYESLSQKYQRTILSNEELQEEIKDIDDTIKSLKDFKFNKEVTGDTIMNLISSIGVMNYSGIDNVTSNESNNNEGFIFTFEFKMFERLNQIVEKYKLMGKVHTENTISVIL